MAHEHGRGNIYDVELLRLSEDTPEQYEFHLNGLNIGYLRLRGGFFHAEVGVKVDDDVPAEHLRLYESNFPAKTKYHPTTKTDDFLFVDTKQVRGTGKFDDDERQYFMSRALLAIVAYLSLMPEYVESVRRAPKHTSLFEQALLDVAKQ
jgi:hypothetical protein